MENITLFWFRRNLRLDDNAALVEAAKNTRFVIPFYVNDPRKESRAKISGVAGISPLRKRALFQALSGLNTALNLRKSALHCIDGSVENAFNGLIQQVHVSRIVTNREPGTEEEADLNVVKRIAKSGNIPLEVYESGALFQSEELPFTGALPAIFTDFRKEIERSVEVGATLEIPSIPPLPKRFFPIPPRQPETVFPDSRTAFPFELSEETALEHLSNYTAVNGGIRTYKQTRNELLGAAYSTKFSPFLALGVLSPRRIWHSVLTHEQHFGETQDTYWVRFELLWREFFRHFMYQTGSAYFKPTGLLNNRHLDKPVDERFLAWMRSETRNPFVDAAMRELLLTGYLSNRMRQNVASYLVHNLGQDWRAGAEWFEHNLLDYDPASNWGNWAYLAGVGNDPRYRQFNLEKQARQYDPQAVYMKFWLPEISHKSEDELFLLCRR